MCSYALTQRALVQAVEGHRTTTLADVAEAECQHDRDRPPPGPFDTYPQPALDYRRARILHTLGERRQSLDAFRASLRKRPPTRHRAHAITQAHLARTLTVTGDLDLAARHRHAFLEHYPHLRSARVDRELTPLRRFLGQFPHVRCLRSLRERAQVLTA
ncbi:hypothetical protein [Embleya hyalina]|uniref:Uncharacterized protein n=1 Tax=Embleya hyalina TaxID=516124 RepID=A0A401YEI7_9ACTN|nr:hypothetical protein [Embleya hyalina]GCD93036.1 hypothetical protein EHYA_00679 [Embleya hyalina]